MAPAAGRLRTDNPGGALASPFLPRKTNTMNMDLAKTLALSAMGGMVVGVVGCASEQKKAADGPSADSTAAADSGATGEKKCCAGKNECEGKGGCKVPGVNECKGQNKCKSKGGCHMREC
jgi:hypothetical protein